MKKENYKMPNYYLKIDRVEWKRGHDAGYSDSLKYLSPKDCSKEKFKSYRDGYSAGYEKARLERANQQTTEGKSVYYETKEGDWN